MLYALPRISRLTVPESANSATPASNATTTCTSVLAAGTSCAVVVNFASATVGSPTSDAVVISQGGVTKIVPVTVNVLAAAKLAATPLAAAFTAGPGTSSSPLNINVGNIGGMTTGQLGVFLGGTNSADFKITSETCSVNGAITITDGVASIAIPVVGSGV